MAWVIRILIILLIVRALVRLVGGVIQGYQGKASQRIEKSVPLVRDPVCGTFLVKSRALAVGAGAETVYFCSERCRNAYRAR
jgi:uncharacterized protein